MAVHPESIRVKTSDGAVLHAYCEGNGPVLFLISGLGGTAGFWTPVAQHLAARFTILRFDQRGIAGSTRGTAPCSIATLARDSICVLDAFGINQATVLGHSTGGCIVQCMATMAATRLQRAILSATWIQAGPYMHALFSMRKGLLTTAPEAYSQSAALLSYPPRWLQEHWSVFEKAEAGAPCNDQDKTIIAERIDALLAHDGHEMIKALTMPTLILGAEDDIIVPPLHQNELAALMPESQITMLPTGGHFFPVTRTETFVERLTAFAGDTP
jgi:pimeloyl-ACP methyl ester carboxylesterase